MTKQLKNFAFSHLVLQTEIIVIEHFCLPAVNYFLTGILNTSFRFLNNR
ncbi:MAG: hypothetical protein JWM28_3223 [Chitinophagaceae bacterium]|nr:hypothetical protein [Chitinophagaceae bacterium]